VPAPGAIRRVVKILLANETHFWHAILVNNVVDIENALRQLAPQDRWEVARWLLEDLQEDTNRHAEVQDSGENSGTTPPLPDYSARRRRIFGGKVLPNMVLASRAEEPW
jgi:hypothetical protein